MPDREKYIDILSKTVKTVKEFNEDTPIKISLQCVEDILTMLKEQEEIRQCKDCKFYAGTHPEFAMCSELDICVDFDFCCKYWRTEGR